MRDRLIALLDRLDDELRAVARDGEHLHLFLLGRGALILLYGLAPGEAGTKDLDTIQEGHPPDRLLAFALERFGKGSDYAAGQQLYLEAVNVALPPVPTWYRRRCQEFEPGRWVAPRVWKLEIHDLAVTKLQRFSQNDRADLRALCDLELLTPDELRRSLEKAFPWSTCKDGEPDDELHAKCQRHLDRVLAYLEGRSATV